MTDLYWRAPWWLLFVLYPLLLALLQRQMRRLSLRRYADPQLHAWVAVSGTAASSGRLQQLAMVLFWILLALALAGPRTPQVIPPEARPPQGSLIAVVDLSRSMDVGDMRRSRRAAAIDTLRAWINASHLPEIGLILFAGKEHLYLPPTADAVTLERFISQLPDIRLPTYGNQLAGALSSAGRLLQHAPGPQMVVVLSDGDLGAAAQARAVAPIEALIASGVTVNMLGFGGQKPSPVPSGLGGWLTDGDRQLLSARDDRWFGAMAARSGVGYLRVTPGESLALNRVWKHPPPRIADDKIDRVQWREWFQLPLAAALLLLLGALQRPNRSDRSGRLGHQHMGATAVVLLLIAFGVSEPLQAETTLEAAYHAYADGDYKSALKDYQNVPGYAGRYGEGSSCYRLKEYTCALAAFTDAAWRATTPEQRGRAAYNLGNVYFQLANYRQAVVLYEDAQAHGVALERAEYNLKFAKTLQEAVQHQLAVEAARRARLSVERKGENAIDVENAMAFDRRIGRPKGKPVDNISVDLATYENIEDLIRRGVAVARAVDDGDRHEQNNRWLEQPDAQQVMSASKLWKRLFEFEEGFQASLDRPRIIEGARPW